ncbi:MAG: zinc ribbon domain-containing protein [Gammaproteobacteria bacterium]|nr:zinc ribbon domain-containing protein [Gammaproteobacteria bacterium]
MPIYEYDCSACGHRVEKLQKLGDDPLKDCPACGQPRLQKRISAPGFRLSGGGWYETDFKTNNKKNLSEAGGESKDSSKSPEVSKPTTGTDKPSS